MRQPIQVMSEETQSYLKVNHLEFHFMESLHNAASLRNLNFCRYSARLLRKFKCVLLCDSAVSMQSKEY